MQRLLNIGTRLSLIGLYRILGVSTRIVNNPVRGVRRYHRQGRNVILAMWHEYSVIGVYWYRYRGGSALVADSWRGDVIAGIMKHLGIRAFRARNERRPTSKAEGILGFIRYLRDGHDGSIAVDGPFGPARKAKPGILHIAHKTGHLILPVGASFSHSVRVNGRWDDYRIPMPFTRLHIVLGEAVEVPADYKKRESEVLDKLNHEIDAANAAARKAAREHRRRQPVS